MPAAQGCRASRGIASSDARRSEFQAECALNDGAQARQDCARTIVELRARGAEEVGPFVQARTDEQAVDLGGSICRVLRERVLADLGLRTVRGDDRFRAEADGELPGASKRRRPGVRDRAPDEIEFV